MQFIYNIALGKRRLYSKPTDDCAPKRSDLVLSNPIGLSVHLEEIYPEQLHSNARRPDVSSSIGKDWCTAAMHRNKSTTLQM